MSRKPPQVEQHSPEPEKALCKVITTIFSHTLMVMHSFLSYHGPQIQEVELLDLVVVYVYHKTGPFLHVGPSLLPPPQTATMETKAI
jgi:hypothetical protein